MKEQKVSLRRASLFGVLGLLAAARVFATSAEAERGQLRHLSRVTVPFVENRGQLAPGIAFSAPTFFGAAVVTHSGRLTYFLRAPQLSGATLTETFVSGRPRPAAGQRASTRVSYFLGGDPSRWHSDLPTYEEVRLGEVWRGVAVSLRAHSANVEKVLTLSPGARADRIRLRLDGAESLHIDREGALIARTAGGEVRFSPPVAYQEQGTGRRPVSAAYSLRGSTYGFRLGNYDRNAPVVVDPILQSTYIGGGNADSVNAIAVDPSTGDVLVGGHTYTDGDHGVDGFVARFDPTLKTLLQATYFGGNGGEEVLGIAVHPGSGDVYAAGFTSSFDLPGTLRGAQSASGGAVDGFIVRLDPSLTQLRGATYVGGADFDKVFGIAIHPGTGDVYVGGWTRSGDLPGTSGGAQPVVAGDVDGFVARLDSTLGRLIQSTYVGGSAPDYLHTLALDPRNGQIYVAGRTLSVQDFPATEGGANAAPPGGNGNWDAVVARLDPSLTTILQASYLGSAGADDIFAIAFRRGASEVYVAGWTDYVDLPAAEGGGQPALGGQADGFVARLDSALTTLHQATYFGGSEADFAYGLAVSETGGDVYLTGETLSPDLPGTADGARPAYGGADDAFVARFDATLTQLIQATYLGGADIDVGFAVAVNPVSGEVLAGGATESAEFPGSEGGAGPVYAGGSVFGGDGFATRLTPALADASVECVTGATTLCLNGGRFRVEVDWRAPSQGRSGIGTAVPLTGDTGYFWFFNDANVELVVKVLDARSVNGHFWVFYGALSNVEYTITVTDTQTQLTRTYTNPSGTLASVADTSAFTAGVVAPTAEEIASAAAATGEIEVRSAEALYAMYAALTQEMAVEAAPAAPCAAGSTTLCLNQARFQVEVDWAVPSQARSGHGTAVPLTGDTGYFWFFSSANVELVVKVLDGRPVNGHFWVFYGALSNVQYTITVTDTQTQAVRRYANAAGTLASVADTSAF